jgi:hypothetical protein
VGAANNKIVRRVQFEKEQFAGLQRRERTRLSRLPKIDLIGAQRRELIKPLAIRNPDE